MGWDGMTWAGARCGDGVGSWPARWRHRETGERRWWCDGDGDGGGADDGDDEGDEDGDDVVLQRWMRVPGGSCGVAVRVKHGAVRHCRGLSLASQEQEGTRANTSDHALRHTRSTASFVNITISKYACVRASYPQVITPPPPYLILLGSMRQLHRNVGSVRQLPRPCAKFGRMRIVGRFLVLRKSPRDRIRLALLCALQPPILHQ
jgi:hypothetical protein